MDSQSAAQDRLRRSPIVTWSRRALRLAGLVGAAIGIAFAVRHLDLRALGAVFAHAALGPVALAVAINLGPKTFARAQRTRVLLRAAPRGRIAFVDLFPLLLGGYAAGYLLPGPAEELFHTAALRRRGFRLRDLLSLQVWDKTLGIISVLLLALPFLPVSGRARVALGAGAAVVLGLALIVAGRARRSMSPRRLLEALAWLLISNLASVAMLRLCLGAVGAPLGLGACASIFGATAVAGALPLLPGQIGVVESSFALLAVRLGAPTYAALAAGVLYHATHVVPVALAGLPAMLRGLWAATPPSPHPTPTVRPPACVPLR